jgi:hypothetical protein
MNFSGPLYKVMLGKKGEVEHLVTQTRELKRLTQLLQAELNPSLAPHCHVARLTPSHLTIVVDSPAWSTRLRFQSNSLLRQLSKKYSIFQGVNNIEIKVYPARLTRPAPQSMPRHISPAAAETITDMANSIDEPGLKEALLRLASRSNKPAPKG